MGKEVFLGLINVNGVQWFYENIIIVVMFGMWNMFMGGRKGDFYKGFRDFGVNIVYIGIQLRLVQFQIWEDR